MSHPKRGAALDKALLVLRAIIAQQRPVSLAVLVEALDLSKPTIHRILAQLEAADLIQRTPGTDRYSIGIGLNDLATTTLGSANQICSTRAVLQELVGVLHETCNIGLLDQHEVLYIDRVESDFPLRFTLTVGSRVPSHCTAIGKLLLALGADEATASLADRFPLPRFTENTIVDADKFEQEMVRIRERGYSTNDQEYLPGMVAVAVPVRDAHGRAVAAVAVHAPVIRLTLDAALDTIPALQRASERLAGAWTKGQVTT